MSALNNGVLDGVRRVGAKIRDLTIDGGLPGAPLGYRIRGATQSGAPSSGTWRAGDHVEDRAGAIWVCTAGGTPGTWVTTLPLPAGTAAAGQFPVATGAGTASVWAGPVLYAAAPSGDVSGVTDTPALQALITSAAASGGVVWLQPGTYWVTGLVMRSQVYLRGAGIGSTFIKLAAAANADVIQGYGFTGLTLTGASTWGSAGISDFGIADMTIDGNASAQAGASYGIRVYGYQWTFLNVAVRNCYSTGIWTEWGPLSSNAPATSDGSESTAVNVKVFLCGIHGWQHMGPSDARMTNVIVFENNQDAGGSGIGLWALNDQVGNICSTAAGMNGVNASGYTGTFTVQAAQAGGATDLYASTGTLSVTTTAGTATMTYTGKTATSFTGCTVTAGTGMFATGNAVTTANAKFTINGLQLTGCHSWSNNHTWAAVFDGQVSDVNCHWEGAQYGQLLCRNAANKAGGFVYDYTTTASGCGIQLGDAGATSGIPLSAAVKANSCDIHCRVSSFLQDTAARSAVNWVSCSQSSVDLVAVTKTVGTYTTTIAAGSNGTDLSAFTSGSPGILYVASTVNIPNGAGVITVATALGTVTCTFTGTNGTNSGSQGGASRVAGTQFTGVVATGTTGSGYTMSTGGAVALANIGSAGAGGTVDAGSRIRVHTASSTTALSTAASLGQEYGSYLRDVGSGANAFRIRKNGTDVFNINTASGLIQIPNAMILELFSDNYATQQLGINGATGLVTGPVRGPGGKNITFPAPTWTPTDYGRITESFDPVAATANSAVPAAGTLYLIRVHCPVPFTATNVLLYVITAGGTLTTGECFAGLFTSAGTLIASTADLSTGANSFASSGAYTLALAGGPYTGLAAGDYYIGHYFNGTTGPALARATNAATALVNMGLSNPNLRYCTANTGLTTAMPATFGTQAASAYAWWAGLS